MTRIGAVVAAAGRGSRVGGRDKAALPFQGRSLLERLVTAFAAGGAEPVVCVVSAPDRPCFGARAVIGAAPDAPMSASVGRGLLALPGDAAGALVQPVDAPFTTEALVRAMLAAAGTDPARPVVPVFEGQRGHPVYVPRALFAELSRDPPGGLASLLGDATELPWPDRRVLADIDTDDDLLRWGL